MARKQHHLRKHALLSASGSSRWLACTASTRLEEEFPESSSSVYADEGTLAHELLEAVLRRDLGEITPIEFRGIKLQIVEHELYKPCLLYTSDAADE